MWLTAKPCILLMLPGCHLTARLGALGGLFFMSKRLYVGNLPFSCGDEELSEAFSAYGDVESARVVMDRETGRSKGFGFVEMGSPDSAQAAIQNLHGKPFMGRTITVNEARPREEGSGGGPRSDRGSYRGGGGGGYGGGGGGYNRRPREDYRG